jgi:hypothetical protein
MFYTQSLLYQTAQMFLIRSVLITIVIISLRQKM